MWNGRNPIKQRTKEDRFLTVLYFFNTQKTFYNHVPLLRAKLIATFVSFLGVWALVSIPMMVYGMSRNYSLRHQIKQKREALLEQQLTYEGIDQKVHPVTHDDVPTMPVAIEAAPVPLVYAPFPNATKTPVMADNGLKIPMAAEPIPPASSKDTSVVSLSTPVIAVPPQNVMAETVVSQQPPVVAPNEKGESPPTTAELSGNAGVNSEAPEKRNESVTENSSSNEESVVAISKFQKTVRIGTAQIEFNLENKKSHASTRGYLWGVLAFQNPDGSRGYKPYPTTQKLSASGEAIDFKEGETFAMKKFRKTVMNFADLPEGATNFQLVVTLVDRDGKPITTQTISLK